MPVPIIAMPDAFIAESSKAWDDKCEAGDIREAQLDSLVDAQLESPSVDIIMDAFEDPRELAELYINHRGDLLNFAEILDRKVKAYLRELAEGEI